MQQLSSLTDLPNQNVDVILPDGTLAQFTFFYSPRLQRWLFNLIHPTITLNGRILCTHPNILRQWKNVISFGLEIISTDGTDPFYIEDFASGRVSLYVLDTSEVEQVETQIYGAVA